MAHTWFITGCSSGFGRSLAERRLEAGDVVFATARRLESLDALPESDRLVRLPLDVTRPDQIEAALAEVAARGNGIDVLVNNAGYGYFSIVEEADLSAVRAMFETNVLGLIAVTRAALPLLRRRERSTIVQLSSIAGRIGTPRGAFYQASKWAVEGFSEALFQEVASFGVRVVLIEPGRFATRFSDNAMREDPERPAALEDYRDLQALWNRNAEANIFSVEPQDAREVVEAIEIAVDHDAPFLRIPLGEDAVGLVERRREMGEAAFVDWIYRAYHEES